MYVPFYLPEQIQSELLDSVAPISPMILPGYKAQIVMPCAFEAAQTICSSFPLPVMSQVKISVPGAVANITNMGQQKAALKNYLCSVLSMIPPVVAVESLALCAVQTLTVLEKSFSDCFPDCQRISINYTVSNHYQ